MSDVYDNFEVGSQVFFCFSQFSYLVCNQSNQIWLNYFMVGRHFDYITKPWKAAWVGGCRPAPFSSMLSIGFTGPSSLLNRLLFIGFITPAKEEDPYVQKSLYKTIPWRVEAQHMMQSHAVLSCKKFEIFHLHLPLRLLQTRTKIVYVMCTPLCTTSSLPYLLSFQVTRKEKLPIRVFFFT